MPDTGPHVGLATFCDKALLERDGVLSVIRAIDRLTVVAQGGEAPAELPQEHKINPTLVIGLRSDQALGRHQLIIEGEEPDGNRLPSAKFDLMFEGGERGINIVAPIVLNAKEGLYWFTVKLGDQLLTKVPLRVIYQRMPTLGQSPPG